MFPFGARTLLVLLWSHQGGMDERCGGGGGWRGGRAISLSPTGRYKHLVKKDNTNVCLGQTQRLMFCETPLTNSKEQSLSRKRAVARLKKKLRVFHGTRRFNIVFTAVCTPSQTNSVHTLSNHRLLYDILRLRLPTGLFP